MSDEARAEGWYEDPVHADRFRRWDGSEWTDDVSDTPSGPLPAGVTAADQTTETVQSGDSAQSSRKHRTGSHNGRYALGRGFVASVGLLVIGGAAIALIAFQSRQPANRQDPVTTMSVKTSITTTTSTVLDAIDLSSRFNVEAFAASACPAGLDPSRSFSEPDLVLAYCGEWASELAAVGVSGIMWKSSAPDESGGSIAKCTDAGQAVEVTGVSRDGGWYVDFDGEHDGPARAEFVGRLSPTPVTIWCSGDDASVIPPTTLNAADRALDQACQWAKIIPMEADPRVYGEIQADSVGRVISGLSAVGSEEANTLVFSLSRAANDGAVIAAVQAVSDWCVEKGWDGP